MASTHPPGRHRLAVLLFTDIVDSVQLQRQIGTHRYAELLRRHDALFAEVVGVVPGAEVINHTGDGFLARFDLPSDAVAAALRFQYRLLTAPEDKPGLLVRIGLHQGEILEDGGGADSSRPGAVGMAVNLAARIMGLATGGQILLTRPVFDEARLFVREHPPADADADPPPLEWRAHGPYLLKGSDEPIDVFEVGARDLAPLDPPADSDKAVRSVAFEDAATLGWRPAAGLEIPRRQGWQLAEKLGEGGFGEVWLAQHPRTREQRVFKFCFDPGRLRSFKRELTLFRLIRDGLGRRNDIASLHEVQVEAPPFYLESDYCEGGNLRQWAERAGGMAAVPMETRLDLVARICRAVAAAHSLGIIHRDIKPSNVFVNDTEDGPRPQLADFGIGVISDMDSASRFDVTLTGFTQSTPGLSDKGQSGTRVYAAPEYLVGRPPTVQGDIYALGVLLYQAVTGELHSPMGTGWERNVADPLLREDIALAVDVDPQLRLASAADLAERLESLKQRHEAVAERERLEAQAANSVRNRRRLRWLLAASAAGIALTIGTVALAIRESRQSAELDRARAMAVQSVVSLLTSTGAMRGDTANTSLGTLWMAGAARAAAGTPAERSARIRMRNYARSSPLPIAAFAPTDGSWVRRMVFHPQEARLLALTGGWTWEAFDIAQGGAPVPLPGSPVQAAAWNADGSYLAVADAAGTVRLLDDATAGVVAEATARGRVSALAISDDGNWLAAAGTRLTFFRIDAADGRIVLAPAGEPLLLDSYEMPVRWAGFAPDNSAIALASLATKEENGMLEMFRIPADGAGQYESMGRLPHRMISLREECSLQPPLFTPDNRLIVFPDRERVAPATWATGTLVLEPDLAKVDGDPLRSMAVDPGGSRLAFGGFRHFDLLRLPNGTEVQPRTGVAHDVMFLGFTPARTHLVTATNDGLAATWRLSGSEKQTLLRQWNASSGPIDAAALSPDATMFAVADATGPLVRVWAGLFGCAPEAVAGFDGGMSQLAVSRSGRLFAPAGSSFPYSDVKQIAVFDAATCEDVGPMWALTVPPQAAVFSADERFLFTAGGESGRGLLQKWDFRTGLEAIPPLDLSGRTADIALSPDGDRLAVFLMDGSLHIVDAGDLRPLASLAFCPPQEAQYYFVNGLVDWHPDSDLISVASIAGDAAVFRFEDDKLTRIGRPIAIESAINVLSPVPGGRFWMAGGTNARLFGWDPTADDGDRNFEFALDHPSWVFGAEFSDDGTELLTCCRDGSVRIWEGEKWSSRPRSPARLFDEAYFARWVPGGCYVTGAKDTSIRLWEKSTGKPMMPPMFTGRWPLMAMELAGDNRSTVLASSDASWVVSINLADWLDPPAGDIDDLQALAELLANTALNDGNEELLAPADWSDRWDRVRQSDLLASEKARLASRTTVWHLIEFAAANARNSQPAIKILSRALSHSPTRPK